MPRLADRSWKLPLTPLTCFIESLGAITEDAEGNLRLLTRGGVERAFLHGYRPPLLLVE